MRERDVGDLASQVTDWKARGFALALTVFGSIAAGASTQIKSVWLQNTALALATTIISTGALSLLFEIALRRNVYREMLRLSGITRSISSQQLISAGRYEHIKWPDIFRSKSAYSFLITDLNTWVIQNINGLLDNGRIRPITVRFIIVDPESPHIEALAVDLGRDIDSYARSIIEAADHIERSWKDYKARGWLSPKSKIDIRLLDRKPLYTIATCDDTTIVAVPVVTGRVGADTDYYYQHEGDRSQFPGSWHKDQIDRLNMLPIRFSDRI